LKQYPVWSFKTLEDALKVLGFIVRERQNDVREWDNLAQIYMSGRKVGKIPSASNDVAVEDRLGDFSFAADASYMYFLVDNVGTTEWRRAALGSW